MLISSKGRYALRLMIYIAALGDAEGKIALREVADREHISQKYLEQLVRPLMKAGLLKSSTVKFWRGLDDVIEKYVDGVTLADLAAVPEINFDIKL